MSRTVLVSAGHSTVPPLAPGAIGNGYKEANLTLELRDLIVPIVRSRGIVCRTDGEVGFNIPLEKAIRIARTVDIAMEIHFDGSKSNKATGCEGIAHPNRKKLAQELARAVTSASRIPLHGGKDYIPPEDSHLGKLGFCDAGGVILEVGFISSPVDVASYQESKGAIAEALAAILVRYATSEESLGGSLDATSGSRRTPQNTQNRRLTRPTRALAQEGLQGTKSRSHRGLLGYTR